MTDAERAALEQRIAELEREVSLQKQMVAAVKHSVVATVGGVDSEGFPTSKINYLQRLRILVEKEVTLTAALKERDARIAELERELGACLNFRPDAAHVNSLPRELRRYIHDLVTNADPAGTIAEAICQRENAEALSVLVAELESDIKSTVDYISALTAALKTAREIIGRVRPVLAWLDSQGEDTVGRQVARQLQPELETALQAIDKAGE